jgi:hypothetical protein
MVHFSRKCVGFKFEPLSTINTDEINNMIKNSLPLLTKNLDRFITYLKNESDAGNYVEIDFPVLDSNISYKLNLFFDKLMVSVMHFDDSKVLGHLSIDNYDCLDTLQIKSLGDWNTHRKKIKIWSEFKT